MSFSIAVQAASPVTGRRNRSRHPDVLCCLQGQGKPISTSTLLQMHEILPLAGASASRFCDEVRFDLRQAAR